MIRREYKKLLANTGLLAVGSFASSLLGMLLIPFYTAILSTADYGISDLITTTTSLLYPFTTMAVSESIMRFALDKNVDKKSVFSIGISLVTAGFVILLCAIPIIKSSTIGEYYIFFLMYYICYCVHTITSYFVKGLEAIKIYSLGGLINSAVVISCNLLFLLVFRMGIKGYLLSMIIGHVITVMFMAYSEKLHQYIIPFWKIDRELLKQMLRYSIPIIPNSISWWVANSSDKYVLNAYTDVAQVGIYSVSYKIPTIMMTVMGFFIAAWQISAVEDFGSERSRSFFSDVYQKCFVVNAILASGLIAFSKIFGGILYSNDFFTAWKYVPVLVLANVFNVLASFLGTVYTASKKTKMLSISTMMGAALNIAMNFLLIPSMGAMGAAIATAMSYCIMWIIRVVNTRKIIVLNFDCRTQMGLLALIVCEIVLMATDTFLTNIGAFGIMVIILVLNRTIVCELIQMTLGTAISKIKRRK